jgi:Tol biopolymer transport system component
MYINNKKIKLLSLLLAFSSFNIEVANALPVKPTVKKTVVKAPVKKIPIKKETPKPVEKKVEVKLEEQIEFNPKTGTTEKKIVKPKTTTDKDKKDLNQIYKNNEPAKNTTKTDEKKVEDKKTDEKKEPVLTPLNNEVKKDNVTPETNTTPVKKDEKKVEGVTDEVDLITYAYLNNLEIKLDLFNLLSNNNCSKDPKNCSSDESLSKEAKNIIDILKNKNQYTENIPSEAQVKYLLMNSVTIKDKVGDSNIKKLAELRDNISKINTDVFKDKKNEIIKLLNENLSKKPDVNPTVTTTDTTVVTNTTNTENSQNTEVPQETNKYAKGKIVYVSERDGNPEIYTMNPDGTEQNRLTNNESYDLMPVFSPDGTKIAFVSERDGNPEIYTMNNDGTNQERLTEVTSYDYSPCWSPDGTKIIFVSNREVDSTPNPQTGLSRMTYKIFVMNADGTDQLKISEETNNDESPRYSPDGSKIVFVSKRDGNPEIYTMKSDGTEVTRLTKNTAFDIMPAWSPDGKKIVFRTEKNSNPEIYTMNEDGSNKLRLTTNLVAGESPFFSFDGEKIVFVSKRDNVLDEEGISTNEIYVMNSNGTNINRLTNNLFDDYSPNWSK